ncbi:MAG: beta-galactosidase [Actinomycetaceae bacterium]|nr:beta-galactosidase [Actinomycetaceae bacterium]
MTGHVLPTGKICYGGDWNPDQWPTQTVSEDIELMREAGVNLVSLAIFSWAKLEPEPGVYEFGWLRDIMDQCAQAGIFVDLATATASPPVWMARRDPSSLPVNVHGTRLEFGSRQQYCPSSTTYRKHSRALARALAEEFADHPALVLWHVNNEYGCHILQCYCDNCETEFQQWLREKYGTIDALNHAWNTYFWAQTYSDFSEIHAPRDMPTFKNAAHELDYWRFADDQLLALYLAEREELRAVTPTVPVTTNFMGEFTGLDYWKWAQHVDVISDDSYPEPAIVGGAHEVAFTADLMRGLGNGRPFILMEQVTSAVQWRPQNATKRPGQFALWSMSRVAHGADGILQFQWRQSPGGAETFHGGMVAHSGKRSRYWPEVVQLGRDLEAASAVIDGRIDAEVAIIVDWDATRARQLSVGPTEADANFAAARAWHRTFWEKNIACDLVSVNAELDRYRIIIVPEVFIDYPELSARLTAAAENGAHVVVAAPTGAVDSTMRAVLGGYLGSLAELVGVVVTDHSVRSPDVANWSKADQVVADPRVDRITRVVGVPGANPRHTLDVTSPALERALDSIATPKPRMTSGVWGEYVQALHPASEITKPTWLNDEVEVIAQFSGEDGCDLAGWPAITRREVGRGAAWYVATDLESVGREALTRVVGAYARLDTSGADFPDGIERVKRGDVTFYLNHSDRAVQLAGVVGWDLISGQEATGHLVVAPRSTVAIGAQTNATS